jgi:hypothetical protein
VIQFFKRENVNHLPKGFEIVSIDEFEEGGLARRLFKGALRKM